MATHEIEFLSFNGRDTIQGWVYTPVKKPKGIIQLVHGFGEHSRRYFYMISKFVEAGYIVAANDHIGHGKTAQVNDSWGDFGDKGYLTAVEDEYKLFNIITEKYPSLPVGIYGHSWGSLIVRKFVSLYGDKVKAAVFCGTTIIFGQVEDILKKSGKLVKAGKGNERDETLVGMLFSEMKSRYPEEESPSAWISVTPEVIVENESDPFNNLGMLPTIQSIHDFCELITDVNQVEWSESVPKELPIYNIAGDQDPVGNYGEGVYHVSNMLWSTGHTDIQTRIYPGFRHEIHNEPEIKDEVIDRMIEFYNNKLK
ncbi:alpha/beta hydrolase [Vagococcus coleopterorum]|uniref:Alpha/beta hydrolase n=1 Tax=Vagococcus coleopterorum TaxID=2714946 RepID=A0A6G8AMB5_9ENTE|nr:alpha/beta fold hydrolase [Vagococcus coleopterorum]QIL46224.1 alpha/beta hydrolase [Vagococcus coleopterorum]